MLARVRGVFQPRPRSYDRGYLSAAYFLGSALLLGDSLSALSATEATGFSPVAASAFSSGAPGSTDVVLAVSSFGAFGFAASAAFKPGTSPAPAGTSIVEP